jgi:hypothetical protein
LTPGYAASKSLATFSALGRASEVYQTTLPSFFAASTRASSAAAGVKDSARPSARKLVMWRIRLIVPPFVGEGLRPPAGASPQESVAPARPALERQDGDASSSLAFL